MSERDQQTGAETGTETGAEEGRKEQDLGPMPEPQIEPGEPAPGGADAVWDGPHADPATPDLSTLDNPAVDEPAMPEEMKQGEDTSTQATRGDEAPMGGEEESPA